MPNKTSLHGSAPHLNLIDSRSAKNADAAVPRDPRVEQAARLYEKQFLREMVKAMRSSVVESELMPANMGEKIFRDQLDNEYVEVWGDSGGIGLADMIYDEIMSKVLNQGQTGWRPQGALALSDRDIVRVSRLNRSASSQVQLKVELSAAGKTTPGSLRSPWGGQILSQTRLDSGEEAVTLEHGPGWRSTFVFRGSLAGSLKPGDSVGEGGVVGVLSPEINSFFWNLSGGRPGAADSAGL